MNVYRYTSLDVRTVKRWVSCVNDNPKEKEISNLSDKLFATVNADEVI